MNKYINFLGNTPTEENLLIVKHEIYRAEMLKKLYKIIKYFDLVEEINEYFDLQKELEYEEQFIENSNKVKEKIAVILLETGK